MPAFDLTTYLDRLGMERPAVPDAEALQQVQRAQLRALSFESFDPYLGSAPDLDLDVIVEKILHRRRGGYCFELNALFGAALSALGFQTRRALGRVRKGLPEGGPRTHLLMTVTIGEERFIADAGFGGPGALEPLKLVLDVEQDMPNGRYRLIRDARTDETVIERWTNGQWGSLYGFDAAFVVDADVAGANHICATWSRMPFPNHLMLAGFDGNTRIGVFGRNVTRETAEGDTRTVVTSEAEFASLVRGELRIGVDDRMIAAAWARIERDNPLPAEARGMAEKTL